MAYLFAVFGESIMAENVITDKVVGESGASNSNAINQSQIVESQVKKGRKKDLVREIIFLVKLILIEMKRVFATTVRKSILLIQKNMV